MRARLTALASVLAFAIGLTCGRAAEAEPCPLLPVGLRCAPLPAETTLRGEALRALDVQGRQAADRGDWPSAATAFGCLLAADPTPESAGNLSVVLREQKALADALLIARCAEHLAPAGPQRERAQARRLEMEHRLGLPTEAPAPPPTLPAPVVAPAPPPPAPPPAPRLSRGWSYAALALGVSALFGAGALYATARGRAHQFDGEQLTIGYSDRARSLHDDAQSLESGSWVAAGLGAASLAAGAVLLRF